MNKYQVLSAGTIHTIEAVTFTQGAELRFIGEGGTIVAIFTAFEWLKVVPAETAVKEDTPTETASPEVSGE